MKKFTLSLIVFILMIAVTLIAPPPVKASIYYGNDLILEAEDYYEISAGITPYSSVVSVSEIASYPGETNDSVDEWLRIQPIDFREGYTTVSIRYAHAITAYTQSVDIYNSSTWTLYGSVTLPSTGGWSTFNTATLTLSATISGKKDLTFIFRDTENNQHYLNLDYISFGGALSHSINQNYITDFSLFANGKPDTDVLTSSNSITITGNGDYIIENKKFYPAYNTYAISVTGHTTGKVIIRNCYFGGINGGAVNGLNPGNGKGVFVHDSSNVTIENNYFDYIQEYGIWCENDAGTASNNLIVANNRFYSMQGQYYAESNWGYQSKCVQFYSINGSENKIWYNRCFNYPGYSLMCDFINVYNSAGPDVYHPIKVYYNAFLGGREYGIYNKKGAGIQIGDHTSTNDGGQYVYAKYNRLVYPGMVGMNINGGYNMAMMHNYVYSDGQAKYIDENNDIDVDYLWTAMSLFNYSGGSSRDSNHLVIDNHNYFAGYGSTGAFVNETDPSNTTITTTYHDVQIWPLDILPYDFMS